MRKSVPNSVSNGSAGSRRSAVVQGKLPALFQRALDDLIKMGKRRALTGRESRTLREALSFLDDLTILRLEQMQSQRK